MITNFGDEISLTDKELCHKPIEPSKKVESIEDHMEELAKSYGDYDKQKKKNCEPIWSTKKYLGPMGVAKKYDGMVFHIAEKEINIMTYKGSKAIDSLRCKPTASSNIACERSKVQDKFQR